MVRTYDYEKIPNSIPLDVFVRLNEYQECASPDGRDTVGHAYTPLYYPS